MTIFSMFDLSYSILRFLGFEFIVFKLTISKLFYFSEAHVGRDLIFGKLGGKAEMNPLTLPRLPSHPRPFVHLEASELRKSHVLRHATNKLLTPLIANLWICDSAVKI